jgi:hypothetical protein
MPESQKVINKIKELYPYLVSEEIGVRAIPNDDTWLVFFSMEGHEEVFSLPRDFVSACVEQGFCHLYREEITRALGLLTEATRSFKTSAAMVVDRLTKLVPELRDPDITIAVHEEEPAWQFFMTKKGASRPVDYRLPMEVIERCVEKGDCEELRQATLMAYRCLVGD